MSYDKPFTKDNMDYYFKELAKEFKRLNGSRMPAEIILIGGASILANYGFREMTYDIDAIINASSAMKDAINKVGDKLELPVGWMNTDFIKTSSYTTKLAEYSKYYRSYYNNLLTIRTVSAEYLVAMKLMSGRQYKNDLSDIIGILMEHQKKGEPLKFEQIKKAVINLYGDWEKIPNTSKRLAEQLIQETDYEKLYDKYRDSEKDSKESLIEFEEKYPGVTNRDNVNDIINMLRDRRKK